MNQRDCFDSVIMVQRAVRKEIKHWAAMEGEIVKKRSSIREISPDCDSISENGSLQDGNISLKSISVIRRELPESNLGWPLLRRTATQLSRDDSRRSRARSMSLVEWVMSLPSRSCETIMENRIDDFCSNSYDSRSIEETEADDQFTESISNSQFDIPEGKNILNSSNCRQFSYKELDKATDGFSAENLIGEGGCSNVYRGRLCWGKQVAVKVLKLYEKAWDDFSLEVEILSSLQHNHITCLVGGCIEDDHLIMVYDFLSKGSLEDILRGQNENSILSWKARFKLAVSIAEALNYLHNICSPPVIHRDVKSSNILLSDDFQPRLSDFGLAIWGETDSASTICSDIVGTFGYIAPEYFMDGRVSDKIDIYSFGVVLLELLSGNMPISCTGPKGQESLVKWAMPLLESGNLEALLDSKLGDEFDSVQMQRMVLAATLCIKQSPRLRPNASQILELLREEKKMQKWINSYINYVIESSHEELNELDSSVLGPRIGNTAVRSVEDRQHLRLKDYLKEQQD